MPPAAFWVATLALNFAPGPDMTYVAARSLGQGRRAGLVSALGIATGCLVHIAAASLGLAALLRAWPRAATTVRLAGAVYLVVIGVNLVRHAAAAEWHGRLTPDSLRTVFRQGAVTNVLNPKVALFFLAFLPQFVDVTRGPAGVQMLVLGLCFNLSGTLVNVAVAWVASGLRGVLIARSATRAWIQRASGSVLVLLGLSILRVQE
jgi:threonine/homoserine/homoserine lactone efflux protein